MPEATNSAAINLALSSLTATQRNGLGRATAALDALAQAIDRIAPLPDSPARPAHLLIFTAATRTRHKPSAVSVSGLSVLLRCLPALRRQSGHGPV